MDDNASPIPARPWAALYARGLGRPGPGGPDDMLGVFREAVVRAGPKTALTYFDQAMTYAELDAWSDAAGAWMRANGVAAGDRVALVLQNTPWFPIALVGAWKAGAVALPINPMNRARELGLLFADAKPKLAICDPLVMDEAREAAGADGPRLVAASALDFQSRNDPRVLGPHLAAAAPSPDLAAEIEPFRGRPFVAVQPKGSDLAALIYTSGTTGLPKGAMIPHSAAAYQARAARDWVGLAEGDGVLGLAPLFHVTGLIAHVALAFVLAAPLSLSYRFHPEAMLDDIREHRPAFAVGAITAFIALGAAPGVSKDDFASFRTVFSGGAPVPASVVEDFETRLGFYVHNIYGLTETVSPSHGVPRGARAPVDPTSGALSVGIPLFGVASRIVRDNGTDASPGEYGEIFIKGPMVVPGYWNKPEESAKAITDGWLHTGDVGFMDEAGWFYLVDRKKDMIVASGFKVWPREVEDVLYTHPAIREAAVVGDPDAYRGETVRAVISLRPGMSVEPAELEAWCRERMAAYKAPRVIEIVEDLPKTATGKILRRELRTGA
ncbi:MAG TPA: AMP-binding protein [Caulobacteraceae bacterium]|nr:AMP-binding protein [Caulobacteraceae bacterium]